MSKKCLKKLRLATSVVMLFAFLGANAQTWENIGSSDVISAGNSSYNNLVVDQNGNYYVSYYDLSVTKASVQKFDGASWSYLGGNAGITPGSATYSSLSCDGLGNVFYSNQYSDFSSFPFTYEMEVRQFNGTSWTQIPSAFSGGDGVNYQASAVSSSNILFAYAGPGGGTVKRYVSGAWEQVGTANIAGATPNHAEMVIGSDGTVYVCHNASGVRVFSNSVTATDTDAWTLVGGENVGASFTEGVNATTDMAIDANNNIYVVFSSNAANNRRLNVKKFNGTSWEQLGDANFGISNDLYNVAIAVTPSGKPYVVASGWAVNSGKNTAYTLNEDTNIWETFGGDFISDGAATYNDLVYDAVNDYLVLTYSQLGLRMKRIGIEDSPVGNGITGYNYDIIANGIGNASDSSDLGMDEQNQRALVSLDFQATESSAFPTYGLPANGIINSANTAGITYQLADYSGANALYLTPPHVASSVNTQSSGTLSFSASDVGKIYILSAGCGFGDDYASLPYTATVNFGDGTSQTETLQLRDWYNQTGFAIQGIGRVHRTNNNLEGDSSNPRLYEEIITLNTENQSKTITGITFSFNGEPTAPWEEEIRMAVLSVATTPVEIVEVIAVEVAVQGGAEAEITTTGGTLQLVAAITPENATNQDVIWSVESGSDFAWVDENGLVTAIANGTATIRATSDENDTVFDEIEIVVSNQSASTSAYTPLVLTGFNADVIAEGTGGNAPDKSTHSVDAFYVFYATDFVPLNPHSSASSAAAYGGGFATNGLVTSENVDGLYFQLADYDTDNALVLRNNVTNQGTLTLQTPQKAEKIYLAAVRGEGGSGTSDNHDVTATINFSDSTSEDIVFQATAWWHDSNPPANRVYTGAAEVSRNSSTTGWAPRNEFRGITQAHLFYNELSLNPSNYNKDIVSVSFDKVTTSNNSHTTAILGITVYGTPSESIPVTAIEVTAENNVDAEIATIGGTLQLIATITPTDATNQNVTWSVESGSDFVSVNANGLVTALANGTATVRATSVDNTAIYDEIEVTVNYVAPAIPVTAIEVTTENDVDAEIATIGGTLQLVATITPTDATNQEVIWSVESGSDFASVDEDGLVTALANGTATIRATSDENDTVFDEIEIIVSNQVEPVACSFFTLSVTGYNEDIIAEGTGGNATDKSTNSIDGNWYSDVFYAQDFVPLNPHSSASSAAAYGGGIPVNGTVSSAATIGLTYQFAPFDQNNGLILRNNTTNTGTLTLTTPVQAQRIYIALVSTEGTNSITAAVNFQDGTSEVFSGITATDWYQNTVQPNNVVNEIGRVARGGAGSLENNFTGLTQTGIYQHEIQLSTANFEKYVISVDFSQTPPANNWTTTAVFALSACGTAPEITPVTAIEITTENDVDAEIATIGGTLQLIATITPTDATNQNVTWSVVSGSAFVSVDADGLVTAIANGTATVRATSVDNTAIYDEIEVTVNYVAPVIPVTSIEVTTENDVDAEIVTIGGALQLIATITPTNATNQNVTWSVESGSDFVSVDTGGLVTAIANGTATVRATSVDNTVIYDEIEVTVNYVEPVIPVTTIEVTTENDVEAEITVLGDTLQLIATITPTNATNQEVTWSVESGSEYVSVDDNGLVTALSDGTAMVRATSVENDTVFDEIEVVVSTLSIKDIFADNIKIYPNPTNGILNIDSISEIVLVEVYNLVGQKTVTYKNISKVDFSTLPNGVYIVKIQTQEGEIIIRKITKSTF